MKTDGTFETFEHTADVGIRVRASRWPDLLLTAAEAFYRIQIEPRDFGRSQIRCIELEAESPEQLLLDWLRELLYLFDAERFVMGECQFEECSENRLEAGLKGEIFSPAVDGGGSEIKAVTYHDLKVEKTTSGYEAEVVFDI